MNEAEQPYAVLKDLIQDLGYRAQISETGKSLRSSTAGLKYSIQMFSNHSVQFTLSIRLDKTNLGLPDVNDYNAKYRFAKLYLDKDNDLMLEADFLFDIDSTEAGKDLENILNIWEVSASQLRQMMFDRSTQDESASKA